MRTMLMVAAVAVVGWVVVVAPAQAADPPIFFTVCTESHRLSDDPIVAPGRPGAAHSHDFTGAWSTDAHSTVESMRRSGTTCDLSGDTAGYWTPTLFKDGTPVRSTTFAYYVNGQKDRATIKAHPAGLKVVADMSAGYGSGWHCGDGKPPAQGGTLSQTTIPDCPDDNIKSLQAKIVFPDCWDGRNLDSPDHRSHMAYASQTGKCPASHPVPVPRLNLKTRYVTDEGDALKVDPAKLSISSGAPATMHADFFNAWDQAELERLVKRCINDLDRAAEACRGNGKTTDNPNHPNPTPPGGAPAPAPASASIIGREALIQGGPGWAWASKMRVSRARVLRDERRLAVLAPITSRASGGLDVAFLAAGKTTTFSASIDKGGGALSRVRFREPIPRPQARLGTGILTLSYPGDADTRPTEVRLRAARNNADLEVDRLSLQGDGLQARGTVADGATGVVRLEFSYVDATGRTHLWRTNTPIDDGRWTVDERVSADLAEVGGYLSVLYTGDFEPRIRGEMTAYDLRPGQTRTP